MYSFLIKKLDEDNRTKEFFVKDKKWVKLTPTELATHFLLRKLV